MAQTLKFGNGTWATKKGSTLAYNDEDGNYKPLPFAYTGAGKGTRVNKQGLIEVVENDRPRIDYTDSEDGVFLLEKQSTNLITNSNNLTNWNGAAMTSTLVDDLINPSNGLDASKLTQTSSGGYAWLSRTFTGNETFSAFVKKDSSNFVRLYAGGNSVYFNILNGTIETISGSVEDKSIIDYGNGWFRISISVNSTAASYVRIYPASSGSSSSGTNSLFVYGAQLEQGSYASSYIPTQGSVVTRVAETASGSGNSEVFNDSEGVLFADMSALADDGTVRSIALSDGTGVNRINIRFRSQSNEVEYSLFVNGETTKTITHSVSHTTNFHKMASLYKEDDLKFYVNGFLVGSFVSANMLPTNTLNQLNFDSGAGLSDFYGKTKELAYYDTALTGIELETLTSYRTWLSMVNELNLNVIYNG